jgi:cellulose biosynthesis protein BcsQ
MALRVAVANHKGGVAKSTTAMMLSEGLAYFLDLRVLAIDFDPQATALNASLRSDARTDCAETACDVRFS